MLQKQGLIPKDKFKLDTLSAILSTGSPLPEETFIWVYENVRSDLQLSSISGGTDIISCFMLGNPTLPVHSGEIQSKGLGMKVEAFNEKGESVVGEKGELVCTEPFPSMPVYFWDDKDGAKYRKAYFEKYKDQLILGLFIVYLVILGWGLLESCLKSNGYSTYPCSSYRIKNRGKI